MGLRQSATENAPADVAGFPVRGSAAAASFFLFGWLIVAKTHTFSNTSRQTTHFSERRQANEPASATPRNVTSLSVQPSASLQQRVVARQRSYDPLWSPSLS
jgi:hypothetical protein